MPRQPKKDPVSVYTKKVCTEWVNNPVQNPLAKKKQILKVSETGVYGKLKKNCKQLHNVEPRLSPKEETGDVKEAPKKGSLTLEQCKDLQKEPNKNPTTGRKIDPTVLHGIYQRLVKECQQLKEEIEKDAKPSDGDYRPSTSEKKLLQKIRLRNALRAALQPILHTKDSLENRVHFAKVIRTYTEMIQPCVRPSSEQSTKLVLVKQPPRQKQIEEKIYFNTRIGSESQYGVAYMNAGKGLARMLRFSAKVMADSFKEELVHLQKMSLLAEKGLTPNMPITYTTLHCKAVSTTNKTDLIKKKGVPSLITNGKYFVVLNELANGDMHDFFRYTYSPAEYESIILQILFALRAFHKHTGYIHNDAHLGNFLYHKISPGGYWHYKYKKTDIFVPNTGYLAVLWDPGLARPIYERIPSYTPFVDYYRSLRLIGSIGVSQFYKDKKMLPVPPQVFMPFERLLQYISAYPSDKNVVMEYIASRQDKYLRHIVFDSRKLPKNATIINQIPYDLS